MNDVRLRLLFTGLFAAIALGGAITLEVSGQGAPDWLVGVVGAAVGFLFGHAQANGDKLRNG